MIKVMNNSVEVGIERNPLTEQLMKIDESATVKAVLAVDLQSLFISLIDRYGDADTAELIEVALKGAHEADYKVWEVHRNAKDNT